MRLVLTLTPSDAFAFPRSNTADRRHVSLEACFILRGEFGLNAQRVAFSFLCWGCSNVIFGTSAARSKAAQSLLYTCAKIARTERTISGMTPVTRRH